MPTIIPISFLRSMRLQSRRQKHALTNLSIAFTGNLLTSKEDLHRQLDQVKAYYNREVNSHTSYLVIGSLGYPEGTLWQRKP